MPPGAEFAADERRVVEAHDGGDAVRNHDLTAAFAIQFHFDAARAASARVLRDA